jgi:hypothetical protein
MDQVNGSALRSTESSERPVCFVIMPISDISGYEAGHFGRVYEYLLKPAIVSAGFTPLRSDDTSKTDYIVVGIVQRVVESPMVLCDFSARNPNVLYELGIRHAFNRPVTLIRDTRTDKVFDIQGLRYIEYDASLRIDSVHKDVAKISTAIKETATAGDPGFNSVVHLAGIKAATVPQQQEISPDTQLLLRAIGSLESLVERLDGGSTDTRKFFEVSENAALLSEGLHVTLGDKIYIQTGPATFETVGKVVDLHPATQEIFIEQKNGKIVGYSAYSATAKHFTSVPF